MTRVEQERLVGSYLRGEMTAGQEQEFFIQVALDSDLRQTLKAFRVVETAIRKHREAIPLNHAESYNRLMVMLSASAPEPAALVGTTAAGLLRHGIGFFGARFFTWTTAIVAAGALTIGAFVLGPVLNRPDDGDALRRGASAGGQGTSEIVSPASVPTNRQIVPGASQQLNVDPTTGSARQIAQDASEKGRNAAEKSGSSIDPAAIVNDGRKRSRAQMEGNDGRSSTQPDPIHSLLNQSNNGSSSESLTPPTSTKKSGVTIVYNWPQIADQSRQDTIQLRVQVDKDGMKKK